MVASKLALQRPCLCLVTDRMLVGDRLLSDVVRKAVAGGVGMVQVRERDLPGGELLALAVAIRDAIGPDALLIVNERADVALACGADGAHLGEAAMPVREVRALVGDGMLIGRSVHAVEAAVRAEAEGADYLIVGTVFETASKAGRRPAGVELLREVARAVSLPFLGIGGVSVGNVGEVMASGASGAAVVSAVLGSPDSTEAARAIVAAMTGSEVRAPVAKS